MHIIDRTIATRVPDAAAAIAYYSILSFFPLLLFLIAFNSSFLQSAEVQGQILKFAEDYMPGSQTLVVGNIQHLIKASGTVGILGTVMLLWSATLVFAGFAQNINMAWTNAESRHFLIDRLIGLMMIAIMVIVLILSLIVTTLADVLPKIFPDYLGPFFADLTWANHLLIDYLPVLTIFALLMMLYRYVPNERVRWRESAAGTCFTVLALQLTKRAFVLYLSFANSYSLVYGSLGAVVAFMLWIYISSCIILIGGHVSAAVAIFFRPPLSPENFEQQPLRLL